MENNRFLQLASTDSKILSKKQREDKEQMQSASKSWAHNHPIKNASVGSFVKATERLRIVLEYSLR